MDTYGGASRVSSVTDMAEQRRAMGATKVDVFAAVEIPQPASGSPVEIQRTAQGLIDAGRE